MIGPKQFALVVAERRFPCRTNKLQPADLLRSAAVDFRDIVEPIRRRPTAAAWIILARIDEAPHSYIPHSIGGQRVRQMAKSHGRHMRMLAFGRGEWGHQRRNLRIDPVFIMKTLNQLQFWREVPCELPEDLVLFIRSWVFGIGAGLAVVVAQILISRKKPKPIAIDRTADICREVAVLDA